MKVMSVDCDILSETGRADLGIDREPSFAGGGLGA